LAIGIASYGSAAGTPLPVWMITGTSSAAAVSKTLRACG